MVPKARANFSNSNLRRGIVTFTAKTSKILGKLLSSLFPI